MSVFPEVGTEQALYNCVEGTNLTCPETCVSLVECDECGCVVEDSGGGPWGKAMDVIMCLLPILFLLAATLKPQPLPTTTSLPLAALIMFLVRLMYLGSDPLLCCASIVSGLHEALSPISIMGGAILLFETMEATLCMPFMMREMKLLTKGHTVSELMLLFSFAYMIEGASGFGTPVALGAPMLVSLGYPKYESVVTLLLMNTFATVWGAAGTPIWFGFGNLDLGESEFIEVSYKCGIALAFSAYLLLPFVMVISCSWKQLMANWLFFVLSLTTTIGPSLGLSFAAYEFPALIGGMIGCCLTSGLIAKNVGIKIVEEDEDSGRHPMDVGTTNETHSIVAQQEQDKKSPDDNGESTSSRDSDSASHSKDQEESGDATSKVDIKGTVGGNQSIHIDKNASQEDTNQNSGITTNKPSSFGKEGDEDDIDNDGSHLNSAKAIEMHLGERKKVGEGYVKELLLRTFPLWGTVVILIVTRVPQIGLRDLLTRREPSFTIFFQTYGIFKCSASLVLQLENILTYPNLNWKYELLYVPCLIPFALVAFITMYIFRKDLQTSPCKILGVVFGRLKKPAVALFGALILVQLMINEGQASPAFIIGSILSEAFKGGWIAIAALIGALGSFFSGSTTISNLTFGEVQEIAAETLGVDTTAMLAIQASGASAGNGVCLNNIISACTVVGLNIGEGKVIAKTWKVVFGFCVVSTIAILAFFIRF